MERVIGIDLGTTNSVVACTDSNGVTEVIAGKDGDRIVASAVYFPKDGGNPVVGNQARQYAVVEPDRVARLFKRHMGESVPFTVDGRSWSPEELSSLVLKKLVQMAEEHFGEPVRRAVITVPAYFGEPERAATRSAGELIGLQVERILNEPTAAAFAHGLEHQSEAQKVLVFDLGGGTFDVTVMDVGADGALEVVATGGDRRLGGTDFDQLVVDRMAQVASEAGADIFADAWTRQDAYVKAEEVKKELSSLDPSTRPLTAGGRPIMFSLSRTELDEMLAEHLRAVGDVTVHTIEKAGLQPGDIDTVLMVGGSSRIVALQRLLTDIGRREPIFSRNLDEDVARGAAIMGTKLSGQLDPRSALAAIPTPVDAASHGLGITVRDPDTNEPHNSVVIAAGTAIPASEEAMFHTVDNGQIEIRIQLNEGDDEDLDFVRQLGEGMGRFVRPTPKGHPVRMTMDYTADQLIRVRAYDGETGGFLGELEVQHDGLLAPDEKRMARAFLAATDVR